MVVYKNKYQIQIPHAIWTLERHWYYAIAVFLSHLTYNQGVHNQGLYLRRSFSSFSLNSRPSPPQLEQLEELLAVVVE